MPAGEFSWEESDDRIVIKASRARIAFIRCDDRWTHEIVLSDESGTGAPTPFPWLVKSQECAPDHADPQRIVSPVYQEIHRHQLPGDECRAIRVLLTGRLFEHHFSAAVSVIRDPREPSFAVLEFDVADRCRAPVQVLASTYVVAAGSSELTTAGPHAIAWMIPTPGAGRTRLEMSCESPVALAMAEAGRRATRVQALAAIDPGLFTHRLGYRWRWCCESSSEQTR
jgi:hypothetical protein